MGKFFEATAKILTEWKKSKAWHRVSTLIALMVVFSTTYMLILPAMALDGFTVKAESELDAEFSEQDSDVLEEPEAVGETLDTPMVENPAGVVKEETEESSDDSMTDLNGNNDISIQNVDLQENTEGLDSAVQTYTASEGTLTEKEVGNGELDDSAFFDLPENSENENLLVFENEYVRLQASFDGTDYNVPAGLTLKACPFTYSSNVFEAYNQAANEILAEKGNYSISYSAYYDIWFELNGEVVNPAPSAKIDIQYKDQELIGAGEKLFALNYDDTEMILSEDVISGIYDNNDPAWPWKSTVSVNSFGNNNLGHRVVGVLNTIVTEADNSDNGDEETDVEEASAGEVLSEENDTEEAITSDAENNQDENNAFEDLHNEPEIEEDTVLENDGEAEASVDSDEESTEPSDEDSASASDDGNEIGDALTETEDEEGVPEYKAGTFNVLGMDYVVEVTLGEDAKIPAEAALTASEISPESEEYQSYYEQAMGAIGEDGRERENGFARFFDISFMLDGVEIEPDPAATVDVKISFIQTVDQKVDTENVETGDVAAVHFTDEGIENVEVTTAGEAGAVDEISFEASSFSVYGFVFTVDFHYEGVDYSIPGLSQILLSELIRKLNIKNGEELLNVADVEKVEFTDEHLVTVEEVSGVIIYNNGKENVTVDVDEKDFLLTSETPFTSKEVLTIWLANGEPVIVGVTDAQYRYVHLNGQDTMTMQQMLDTDFKSDFAFYYASPNTVSVSSDLYVLSNLSSIPYSTGGSVWVYDWDENVKDWVYQLILMQDYAYEVTEKETITLSEMMASLGVTIPSGTIAVLSSNSAPGIYVDNGNQFLIESTTLPEEGVVYDLYDLDTYSYLPYGLVLKGSAADPVKNDGIFTYAIVDGAAEITGLVDEEHFDPTADPDNYTIPAKTTLDDTEYDVVAIQRDAFQNETRIKTLTLAESETVLRLDIGALSNMPSVTSITGDRQVKFNGIGGIVVSDESLNILQLNIQGNFTYTETPISGNAALTNVELTCSKSSALGSNFLMDCGAVKNLTYHGSTDIGQSAMGHLSNLETIVIDNAGGSAVRISDNAFREMTALKSVEFTGAVSGINYCAFYGDTALKSFKAGTYVGDSISIGDWAFGNDTVLAEFTVGDTPVNSVGGSAFRAVALKKIYLKADNLTISDYAFWNVSNLEELWFDGDVSELKGQIISSYGNQNTSVKRVIITGRTGKIEGGYWGSFAGMPNLETVVFGGGILTLPRGTFESGSLNDASRSFIYIGNGSGSVTLEGYLHWGGEYVDRISVYFNMPKSSVSGTEDGLDGKVTAYFTDGMLSDLYVNPDYTGDDSDGTEAKPFGSIKEALDYADSFDDIKTKFKADAAAAGVGSLNLPFNGGAASDGATLHITTTSTDSVEIPAGVLEDSDILEGIVFENGAATQINIAAGALKNCAALERVEVKNTDAKVTIGKAAFEGCSKLNSICEAEQTVESDAGNVTLAKGVDAMIGTMLVKEGAAENAAIKTQIEEDYVEFDTPTVEYYDLHLEDIHGNAVEGKAADLALTADIPATAWHIYIYHNTGSNVESFRITEENSTVTADKLTEVRFHVDSLSPFATAYCPGTPYHDDMFWYELTRDEDDKVTGAVITGIYDGQEGDPRPAYSGTTLEFTGKTRDDKKYPVTAIATKAFENNTTITQAVFTNENELGVGEDDFSGCTALKDVIVDGKLSLVDADLFENAETVALIKSPDSLPENALTGDKLETIYFGSVIGEGVAQAIANVPKDKKVYVNADKDDCPGAAKLDELLAAKEGNVPQVFYLNSTEEKGNLYIAGTPVTPVITDETTGEVISGPDGSKTAPFNTFAQLSEFMGGKGGKDGVSEEVAAPGIKTKLQPILTAANVEHTVPETFKKTLTGSYTVYVLNTVPVTGNEEWDSDADDPIVLNRDRDNKGAMVSVTSGTLTLKNVVLDGGSKNNLTANAPIIKSASTLSIQDGAVIRNNDNTAMPWEGNEYRGGGGVLSTGNVSMSGGEISGNSATYGGGIHVSGATFDMTGGKITGNVAVGGTGNTSTANGGGVVLTQKARMNLSGGEISDNTSNSFGGGIKVGATYAANESNKATLNMTGGTISGNTSGQEGGGVNIESGSRADVTGGTITGNKSHDGEFGGGGFYVNGDRGYGDAVLTLKNVLITDNTAREEGGGIAGCWTSSETVYYINGAAIYGNHSESDFYVDTVVRGSMSLSGGVGMSASLTGHMFNGAAYNWIDVYTGEAATPAQLANVHALIHNSKAGLKANPDGKQPTSAPVTITGNTADTRGGGIGSNGTVIIGTEPNPNQVKWTPEADKVLYNRDMKDGETFTFTVYEEKASEGFNFWWTKYEDVQVGTGSVTGGKDGKPMPINFAEIDLGMVQPSQVGKTRTFLIVEDKTSLPEDILIPEKYLAITVIYALNWDEENNKEVIAAEVQKIESGRILADGSYDYDDPSSESTLMTPTHNFGRIRADVSEAVFENISTKTSVSVDKTWLNYDGSETPPTGAKVTFEVLADGVAFSPAKTIELDGTKDDAGESEAWTATFTGLDTYKMEDGQLVKDDDGNYVKIAYTVRETKVELPESSFASYTSDVLEKTEDQKASEEDESSENKVTPVAVSHNNSATIENKQEKGNLTISKTVESELSTDKDVQFKFVVTLKNKAGDVEAINYAFNTNDETKKIAFTNGVSDEILLKGGESLTIMGLPAGIGYTVAEELTNDQKEDYNTNPETLQLTGTIPVAATTEAATAPFTNIRKTGDLEVSKTISSMIPVDTDAEFSFTVTLSDTAIGKTSEESPNGKTYGDMTFKNGVAEFTLKHGEKKTATGLPTDIRYTVEETTVTGYTADEATKTGTISTEKSVASFTNTYTASGTATIEGTKIIENRAFHDGDTLTVTLSQGNLTEALEKEVTLTNNATSADFTFELNYTLDDMDEKSVNEITYTITETAHMLGTTPDTKTHTVTVKLSDDKQGHLNSEVTYSDGDKVEFVNTYKTKPISAIVTVQKVLEGREWKTDDTFAFSLAAHSDNPEGASLPAELTKQISSTTPDHKVGFDEITFTKPGEYKFTVTELVPEDATYLHGKWVKGNVIYDDTPKVITFNVVDDLEGNLTIENQSNTYEVTVTGNNEFREELPDAGGVGTIIFYIIGTGLLSVAMMILLISRRKRIF